MGLERSPGLPEARKREEAGRGPERSWRRDWTSKEGEAAARADGGGTAFVLIYGPRAMKATAWLVRQLPSGLPPLPHLDAALPLYERLRHRERDNLDDTSDRDETQRGSEEN